MKEKWITKIILALLGLILMYGAAAQEPKKVEIEDINRKMAGEKITVTGEINNLSATENILFFELESKQDSIKAASFRENLLLREGSEVEASGTVTLYRGEPEMIVRKVRNQG